MRSLFNLVLALALIACARAAHAQPARAQPAHDQPANSQPANARLAQAAPRSAFDLPPACADITSGSVQALRSPQARFSAQDFTAALSAVAGGAPVRLSSRRLDVADADSATSPAQLEQAAGAAAAATLIALTGHHQPACPNRALQRIAQPIVEGLQHGDSYRADWKALTLNGTSGHVSASLMQVDLQSGHQAGQVLIKLTMDGIGGALKPPALLPDRLLVEVSLPAARLPDLLATLGGNGSGASIPLTIEHLVLVSHATRIEGHGTATSAPTLPASTAHLQIDATGYPDLVREAARLDLARLHTALFLCQLVGHKDGAVLRWDVTLDRGVLAVNDLPIPVL